MTTPHRTLQMALDALYSGESPPNARQQAAITALREALAQPAPEPVARVAEVHMSRYTIEWTNGPLPEGTGLYAAPPAAPAVPLTDEQVAAGIEAWFTTEIAGKNQPFEGRMRAAYAAINGITGGKP